MVLLVFCLESAARGIEGKWRPSPRMILLSPATSQPTWATKRAWHTSCEKCTELDQVSYSTCIIDKCKTWQAGFKTGWGLAPADLHHETLNWPLHHSKSMIMCLVASLCGQVRLIRICDPPGRKKEVVHVIWGQAERANSAWGIFVTGSAESMC